MNPIKVKELNNYINKYFKTDFFLMNVEVEGEVTDLKYHTSGHTYLSLKDESARIRVFYRNGSDKEPLKNGMHVVAEGFIGVFEKSGDLMLNAEQISPYGIGKLYEDFLKLKETLLKEGLFDEERKKPIKRVPKKVAIISALGSAAVKDVVNTIRRRNKNVDMYIFPSLMQGQVAAEQVAKHVININAYCKDMDTIIIARGGGSYEDLYAFNDEYLARVVAESEIPVISAIGHDIDFTILDFVCDKRAATPTAAGEYATENLQTLLNETGQLCLELNRNILNKINANREFLLQCKRVLWEKSPSNTLNNIRESANLLKNKMTTLVKNSIFENKINLLGFSKSLNVNLVKAQVEMKKRDLRAVSFNMNVLLKSQIVAERAKAAGIGEKLLSVKSNIFEREYKSLNSMVDKINAEIKDVLFEKKLELFNLKNRLHNYEGLCTKPQILFNDKIIDSINNIDPGMELTLSLKDGKAKTVVREVEERHG